MGSEWISVEERLPEPSTDPAMLGWSRPHLVATPRGLAVASVGPVTGRWAIYDLGIPVRDVTHWMPLPEPPEVDDAPPQA